jgi:hypothetical protein
MGWQSGFARSAAGYGGINDGRTQNGTQNEARNGSQEIRENSLQAY